MSCKPIFVVVERFIFMLYYLIICYILSKIGATLLSKVTDYITMQCLGSIDTNRRDKNAQK